MPDPFALLGLDRRPAVEPDQVDAAFARLAAECHPDGPHPDHERFAALNAAAATLRDVPARLRALIPEGSFAEHAGTRQLSIDLTNVFVSCGEAASAAGSFLKKRAASQSAIARALLAGEEIAVLDALQSALAQLSEIDEKLAARLEAVDRAWPDTFDPVVLEELADGYRYLLRWRATLNEQLHRTAFE